MAVKFKVVQKVNPIKKEDPAKFYAQAEVSGDVTLDTLARRVAKASMATRGDVLGVITSLVEEIIESLEEGNSVKLGDLGRMRVSLSSTGMEKADEVSAHNIRKGKIIFTPSVMLKDRINRISFRQAVSPEATKEETGGNDSESPDEI